MAVSIFIKPTTLYIENMDFNAPFLFQTNTREYNDTSEIGVERFPLAVEEEANKRKFYCLTT